MSNYIINLRPVTPFFFGGEKTFGEDNTHYFVRSNYLPQQTTLLGLLRYELLAQNNLIGTNPVTNNWANLIGAESFGFKNGKMTTDFGIINKISPVFISNGKEHYIVQSMDWATCEDNHLKPIELGWITDKGFSLVDSFNNKIPELMAGGKPYSPKSGLKSLWVSSDGAVLRQWNFEKNFIDDKGFENGLFIEQQQIGIHRETKRTRSDRGDFYKQIFYKMVDNFYFVFFADINLPTEKKFQSRLVTMGGERSIFEMNVNPANEVSFDSLFTEKTFSYKHIRKYNALVLTSDAYADVSILNDCDFAFTDSLTFKNIHTKQNVNGNFVKMGETLEKSSLINLIKRGSIFYSEKLDGVITALKNTAFENIGYNKYIKLQSI